MEGSNIYTSLFAMKGSSRKYKT